MLLSDKVSGMTAESCNSETASRDHATKWQSGKQQASLKQASEATHRLPEIVIENPSYKMEELSVSS